MIATKPAREAFKHIETSGLPYLIQVKIIHTTVAIAGEIVVVRKIDPKSLNDVAAAPLNPYQPNHRMNTPSAPIGILCPGIACGLPVRTLYFPIRGPSILAPISAEIPPTIWIAQDPAKSWNPN